MIAKPNKFGGRGFRAVQVSWEFIDTLGFLECMKGGEGACQPWALCPQTLPRLALSVYEQRDAGCELNSPGSCGCGQQLGSADRRCWRGLEDRKERPRSLSPSPLALRSFLPAAARRVEGIPGSQTQQDPSFPVGDLAPCPFNTTSSLCPSSLHMVETPFCC